MSCHSCHAGSGWDQNNFSSYSVVWPQNAGQTHMGSSAYSPVGIGICYAGAGGFSSSSVGSGGPRLDRSLPASRPHSGVVSGAHSCYGADYSYRKAGAAVPGTKCIAPVTCNESLLQPLDLKIDTTAFAVKCQAKNELQGLNSKLATFIHKVRLLEQQNVMLKTKWDFIQEKKHCKSKMEPLFNEHVSMLKKEMECVESEKAKLKAERDSLEQAMEGHKRRYEEECNKRASTENEFVLLKKDLDCVFTHKAELEAKVESHIKQISFLKWEPPEGAMAAGAVSENNGHPIPVDLTGTSVSASDPPDGERPPPGSGDWASGGYLDSVNPFLTALLDCEQGVTVCRRQGQGSQIPDSGSASWATAPFAGNVLFGDHPSGDISASEAEVWCLLWTSEGTGQAERDKYRRALCYMEQDMEHLRAALAQARQGQGIPGQPVPQPVGFL
uniref:Uncharacterized protein n=1 Tax=Sphaerodactylus townsendi TaxID=933632 RepID=A0ACB8ELG4_9SAUR